MKIGRNEPCPCGSGKKYKKCCIDKEEIDWKEWFANDIKVGKRLMKEAEENARL